MAGPSERDDENVSDDVRSGRRAVRDAGGRGEHNDLRATPLSGTHHFISSRAYSRSCVSL